MICTWENPGNVSISLMDVCVVVAAYNVTLCSLLNSVIFLVRCACVVVKSRSMHRSDAFFHRGAGYSDFYSSS